MRKWGLTSFSVSKLFPGDWATLMAVAGILAGVFFLAAAASYLRRRRTPMMPRRTSLSGIANAANAMLPQVDTLPISLQSPISSRISSSSPLTLARTPRTLSAQGLMELGLVDEAAGNDC